MDRYLNFDLCPTDFVLKMLASRWTLPVLRALSTGPKRPSEMSSALDGVSAKTLTQRLRELEEFGILTRTAFDETPPRVLYKLTDRGTDLLFVLDALKDVGVSWQKSVFKDEEPIQKYCAHCHEELISERRSTRPETPANYLAEPEQQRFENLLMRADARETKSHR